MSEVSPLRDEVSSQAFAFSIDLQNLQKSPQEEEKHYLLGDDLMTARSNAIVTQVEKIEEGEEDESESSSPNEDFANPTPLFSREELEKKDKPELIDIILLQVKEI